MKILVYAAILAVMLGVARYLDLRFKELRKLLSEEHIHAKPAIPDSQIYLMTITIVIVAFTLLRITQDWSTKALIGTLATTTLLLSITWIGTKAMKRIGYPLKYVEGVRRLGWIGAIVFPLTVFSCVAVSKFL